MAGMSNIEGTAIGGQDHLVQSIRDILTTPVGSRVMRRDYGSRLFALIDRPMAAGFRAEITAAVAEALDRWEPRFKLTKVSVAAARPGHLELDLTGVFRPGGEELRLEGIVL